MASAGSPEHSGEPSLFSKFSSALSHAYKKLVGSFESHIKNGRSPMEMPMYPIVPLSRAVIGCNTGPYGGLCQLDPELDHPTHDRESPVVGISDWYRPHPIADGDSITLYEHKPGNTQHHGDPIADVFSVVLRPNNCILAVADGVNWGIKPRLAARCAVHGVMEHLNQHLFSKTSGGGSGSGGGPKTVQDIFHAILRAFHSGQKMIIKSGGTTTTLCVGVVIELLEAARGGEKWGLCVVSVGDSLCYVWREEAQMVHEVTSAMHQGKERNPRDCGGCLGCDLGDQPDLSNLLCCFVPLADEDIVFIVSDGVSDNSDPVILKEALAEGQPLSPTTDYDHGLGQAEHPPGSSGSHPPTLPSVTPEQRQALSLMKLTSILKDKLKTVKRPLHAQDVRDTIINYVIEATETKREYLERCWVQLDKPETTVSERRANERKIAQDIKFMPGKLDHATVAAYKVGRIQREAEDRYTKNLRTRSHLVTKKLATETGEPRTVIGGSVFYGSKVSELKQANKRVGMVSNQRIKISSTRCGLGGGELRKSGSMDALEQHSRPGRAAHLAKAVTVDYVDGEMVDLAAGIGAYSGSGEN